MQLPTAHGALRSWRIEDAAALVESGNNRNVWLTLRDIFPHPYTLADAETFLGRVVGLEPELSFCVEVEGRMAGGIGLHMQGDVHHRNAELGYWLAQEFWGRGIMSSAVQVMVEYGFSNLPLERIEAYVFANNPASARVLEKAAFVFEGRLRRNVLKDGEFLDSLVYARLRDDKRA